MPRQSTPPQIHQQERQIVQNVDAGDLVVEFNPVEQRRTSIEQNDVSKVEIPVTVAHEAVDASRLEPHVLALHGITSSRCQTGTCAWFEDPGALFGEPIGIAVDDPRHAAAASVIVAVLGGQVELRDDGAKRWHQCRIECTSRGEPIKECILIEANHLDEPIHGVPGSPQRQRPVRSTSDGHDTAVERGCRAQVDAHFGLTHRFAPLDRGEVQVVVLDGSLELPRTRPGQEHNRGVRLDSLDRRVCMCRA
jgi:hypothetical protein